MKQRTKEQSKTETATQKAGRKIKKQRESERDRTTDRGQEYKRREGEWGTREMFQRDRNNMWRCEG